MATETDPDQAVAELREQAGYETPQFHQELDNRAAAVITDLLREVKRNGYLPLSCPVCDRVRVMYHFEGKALVLECEKCGADNTVLADASDGLSQRAEAAEAQVTTLDVAVRAVARLRGNWIDAENALMWAIEQADAALASEPEVSNESN